MSKDIYTAQARVTGGRAEGHGESSDHALVVDLRLPPELGGKGGATNPEQLFAVGFAACFESALGAVARRRRIDTGDVAVDARVTLQTGENRSYKLAAELDVSLPAVEDPDQAVDLVRAADAVCPYSNATRGNIEVTMTANGRRV